MVCGASTNQSVALLLASYMVPLPFAPSINRPATDALRLHHPSVSQPWKLSPLSCFSSVGRCTGNAAGWDGRHGRGSMTSRHPHTRPPARPHVFRPIAIVSRHGSRRMCIHDTAGTIFGILLRQTPRRHRNRSLLWGICLHVVAYGHERETLTGLSAA